MSASSIHEEPLVKSVADKFAKLEYTAAEKTEIDQWLLTASHIADPAQDSAKLDERLSSLNTHLSTRTTVLGSKHSVADVALYAKLAPLVKSWTPEQRTGEHGYHHIVRYVDFVQNAPLFGLDLASDAKVDIDPTHVVAPIKPVDIKAEKERKKKEKAAAAAAGADAAAAAGGTVTTAASKDVQDAEKAKPKDKQKKDIREKIAAAVGAEVPGVKKEKKEKQPKQPKQPKAAAPEKPFSPALIDLRVGHILKAIAHPNADSLYVSTIDCGDAPGTENTSEYEGKTVRTVCSGLNGLVPLEEMQNRKVITVCNLKPVTMRGIKSCAMVLAASPRLAPGEEDHHAGPVELVAPPADAPAGERVFFEGFEGEPEAQLNPKKKVWDDCQVGFTTTTDKVVAFEADKVEKLKDSEQAKSSTVALLKTKQGICTVKSLAGATVR